MSTTTTTTSQLQKQQQHQKQRHQQKQRNHPLLYIPIRDDSSLRSLSLNERAFLCTTTTSSSSSWRADGRQSHELRPIQITSLGRWDDGSECTVQWGMTRVTCILSSQLVTPTTTGAARPNEGMVYFSVDLSPMACTSWVHAQPITTAPRGGSSSSTIAPPLFNGAQKLLSNRIVRTLERVMVSSSSGDGGGVIDLEALCVVSGQWVWKLHFAVTVLDMGGNIMDACVLCAMAAVSHYRQPQVSFSQPQSTITTETTSTTSTNNSSSNNMTIPTLISPDLQQATPLPLHHIPLTITFGLCPIVVVSPESSSSSESTATTSNSSSSSTSMVCWIDPTDREELVITGTITLAMNVHGEVCFVHVHGCEIVPSMLFQQCIPLAQQAIIQLCTLLQDALQHAEEQVQKDRLYRLQQQDQVVTVPPVTAAGDDEEEETSLDPMSHVVLPPPPTNVPMPFWQGTSQVQVELNQQKQQQLEEEEYRNMALDYTRGHVAAKVKENPTTQNNHNNKPVSSSSSLLASLLKSAASAQSTTSSSTTSPAGTAAAVATSLAVNKDDDQTNEPSSNTTIGNDHVKATAESNETKTRIESKTTATAAGSSTGIVNNDDDDDEEEATTTLWQSEFANIAPPSKNEKTLADITATMTTTTTTDKTSTDPEQLEPSMDVDDDNDSIDDLAMAIKKKKKKKSKK